MLDIRSAVSVALQPQLEDAMARSCACKTCGKTIRPKAKEMSLGSAVRLHYWREHPEIMRGKPKLKIKTRAKAG